MTPYIPTHLPPLIQDLGFLLLTGGLAALLFGFLRQPLIVGYLLAGFLIGPNFAFFPHLIEPEGIRLWGEIGVLFLLFSLGLEFSFKKLLEVGPSALVAASIEVLCMVALGTWVTRLLGFGQVESLFFGSMLAISSTTVLIRAIEDSGTKSARFAQNVFGILIVEDLYAVLLLVLLAGSGSADSGTEMVLGTLFRFGFFLIVVFVVGMSLLPALIQKTQTVLSDEMRLILSLGMCFTTVAIASRLGFSPTLGAFLMGSLLAGTREARKIESLMLPVQHLFGAVFFISVGLQIEPRALVDHPFQALIMLSVVLVGKSVFVSLGSLVAGKPLKPAVRTGLSMAQIGEFSFIMAALGISLGVLRKESSSLIVMIATITALTTPFFIRRSKATAIWVDQAIPTRWKTGLDRYSAAIQRSGGISEWRMMVRKQLLILVVNSALIGAVGLFFENTASAWLAARFGTEFGARVVSLLVAFAVAAPFFWGVAKGGLKGTRIKKDWMSLSVRPILVFLMILRAVVFIALTGFMVSRFFEIQAMLVTAVAIAGGALLLLSKSLERTYERFTQRFLLSLSTSEEEEVEKTGSFTRHGDVPSPLAPWEGHIAVFDVSFDSTIVGKTLLELGVRERYGVMITLLERGGRKIPAPAGSERIYPQDRLHVIGGDEELAKFGHLIEVGLASPIDADRGELYSLQSHLVQEDSIFIGLAIRECGIREKASGLIVGVERRGERILNPPADFKIDRGDLLWIVGDSEKLQLISKASLSNV